MKYRSHKFFAPSSMGSILSACVVATVMAFTAAAANGDCGNCSSGSYVGDMPCASAGCGGCTSGCDSCDGGCDTCEDDGCCSSCLSGAGSCLGGCGSCLSGSGSKLGNMLGGLWGGGHGNCGAAGQYIPRQYGKPDLFYNYYTQGRSNTANAQMYLSPLPIPPNVGHTFYTYQPFYPHHMLYWHKDRFHRYYDNGRGMNRTKAVYFSPPIRQAASNFYWNYLRLPR